MNTTLFAKRLGVSTKTVHRWIKQFQLDCRKNEHGHYVFDEEDVIHFKSIQQKVHENMAENQDSTPKPVRRATAVKTTHEPAEAPDVREQLESLESRVKANEKKLEEKADEVVSYQILQHRKEIEELQQKVKKLEEMLTFFEKEKEHERKKEFVLNTEDKKQKKRGKRFTFIHSILGL